MNNKNKLPSLELKNEKGMVSVSGIMMFATIFIMLFLMLAAYGVRLYNSQGIVSEIHSAANQIVTMAVTTNAEESYYNKREGYSGAYKSKTHDEILELLTEEYVEEQLIKMLNLNTPAGKKLGKYIDNGDGTWTPLYCIADIDIVVENPKLKDKAKSNSDIPNYIEAKTRLLVYIPFELGGMINKSTDLKLYITASATNVPKF